MGIDAGKTSSTGQGQMQGLASSYSKSISNETSPTDQPNLERNMDVHSLGSFLLARWRSVRSGLLFHLLFKRVV